MVEYITAWDIQRALADARARDQISDTLIVLEHPHTYTLGRSARRQHLLLGEEECRQQDIQVVEVDRGGDITYHGPGQLVAYPIRYLGIPDAAGRLPQVDYVGYIRCLEEVLIQTLGEFGIHARREQGFSGAWVDTPSGPLKIAAIGVRVNASGVSTHGIALNVAPDLSYFAGIIPCGIADKGVTSMAALLSERSPSVDMVAKQFASAFARVFGCALQPVTLESLLSRVAMP
jgi:lipoate-protein ligase B